jgi:hypothetical protein
MFKNVNESPTIDGKVSSSGGRARKHIYMDIITSRDSIKVMVEKSR